jgi:hypothetical protein
VFCCKSAEAIENKGDDVFALARARARRAKETGLGEDWWAWMAKVTTKYVIYGE